MWKLAKVVYNGQSFQIGGLDVWQHKWQTVEGERADVFDPLYKQPYTLRVYTMTDGDVPVKFAAGEFSNGVWGFYVPDEQTLTPTH